jgi:hypothetical protein
MTISPKDDILLTPANPTLTPTQQQQYDSFNLVQKTLRYSMYNLWSSVREGIRTEVNPISLAVIDKGGELYWDGDLWFIPVLIILRPDIAKNVLEARYRVIDKAIQLASGYGYQGSKFPYINDVSGYVNSPYWDLNGPLHIFNTALISINVWNYYRVTQDKDWMINKGYTILKNNANFFVSKTTIDDAGVYHIEDVYSFHDKVSTDNALTNYMIRAAVKYALEASYELNIIPREEWTRTFYNIDVTMFDDQTTQAPGTISVKTESPIVTGTDTTFLATFNVDDYIRIGSNDYNILSIESDTSLTLTSPILISIFTTSGLDTVTSIGNTFKTTFKAGDNIRIDGYNYTIASDPDTDTSLTLTTKAVTTTPPLSTYKMTPLGLILTTAGSSIVTGFGTSFTKTFKNLALKITIGGTKYDILSVESDTSLTLIFPVSSSTAQLPGTVSTTSGSPIVTGSIIVGSKTTFLTTFKVGDYIIIDSHHYNIKSIESIVDPIEDQVESLTLTTNAISTTSGVPYYSGTSYTIANPNYKNIIKNDSSVTKSDKFKFLEMLIPLLSYYNDTYLKTNTSRGVGTIQDNLKFYKRKIENGYQSNPMNNMILTWIDGLLLNYSSVYPDVMNANLLKTISENVKGIWGNFNMENKETEYNDISLSSMYILMLLQTTGSLKVSGSVSETHFYNESMGIRADSTCNMPKTWKNIKLTGIGSGRDTFSVLNNVYYSQ